MVTGVLAGLSDKWNLDVTQFVSFCTFTISNFGIIIYIILASSLPTKEDRSWNVRNRPTQDQGSCLSMMTKVGFATISPFIWSIKPL